MTKFANMEAGQAAFSPDRTYRYWLRRSWDDSLPTVAFIGLNPSTADENVLDPTLRRCVGFAQAWGCGSFVMGNLFAFRATNPIDMKEAAEPVGAQNDTWLRHIVKSCAYTVCAWGTHGGYRKRDAEVLAILRPWWPKLQYLMLNGGGDEMRDRIPTPKHPLYIRRDQTLRPFGTILERLDARGVIPQ